MINIEDKKYKSADVQNTGGFRFIRICIICSE